MCKLQILWRNLHIGVVSSILEKDRRPFSRLLWGGGLSWRAFFCENNDDSSRLSHVRSSSRRRQKLKIWTPSLSKRALTMSSGSTQAPLSGSRRHSPYPPFTKPPSLNRRCPLTAPCLPPSCRAMTRR